MVDWPIADSGGTGMNSGYFRMRRDASGCVGILNSGKFLLTENSEFWLEDLFEKSDMEMETWERLEAKFRQKLGNI